MSRERVRGHGYESELERSREAERGCARSRVGEGTVGCPRAFVPRTGTGRRGSRHAETLAHIQSCHLCKVRHT